MNCIFNLYNLIWENISFLGILAIIELIFIFLIGVFFHRKGKDLKHLGLFSIIFIMTVPISEVFLFCYPFAIAFGRSLFMISLVALGYGISYYVRKRNAINSTATTRKLH